MDTIEVKGVVHRILAQKNDWVLFILKDDDNKEYKCTCVPADFDQGAELNAIIEETKHAKYGDGYKIISYAPEISNTKNGIIKYLSSGLIDGVGQGLAERIYNQFGNKTLDIMRHNPERLSEVSGISQKRLLAINEAFLKTESEQEIFCITNGVATRLEVTKILGAYGNKAVEVIKKDPYKLINDIDGFGFLKADRIARGSGVSEFSSQRMKAAIVYALEQIAEAHGDCYVTDERMQEEAMLVLNRFPKILVHGRFENTSKKCAEKIAMIIAGDECYTEFADRDPEGMRKLYRLMADKAPGSYPDSLEKIVGLIQKCIKSGKLERGKETHTLADWLADYMSYTFHLADAMQECIDDGSVVYEDDKLASKVLYYTELEVAKYVMGMEARRPEKKIPDKQLKQFIAEYEKEHGIELAKEQKKAVSCAINHRISIITGGPGCGKTTNIQTIVSAWKKFRGGDVLLMAPTGRASQRIRETINIPEVTIATIHKMTGVNNKSHKPLVEPHLNTLIICDEASMVDIKIARIMMRFAAPATLVLVGDANQLPPVGAGNFFRDLIKSKKVPVTKLVLGFRNTGLIAQNADFVNRGKVKEVRAGNDFRVEMMEREFMAKRICDEYMAALNAGMSKKDMCILTLQKTRGAVCTSILNKLIQDACCPVQNLQAGQFQKGIAKFRPGDRVMQTKNDYDMPYSNSDGDGNGVFNGDVGTVIGFDGDGKMTVEFDDGRQCIYDNDSAESLILAYAITVHKSQGSEYKKIWIAISMDQYVMLSRSIVYTAITRASGQETLVCEKKAFMKAVMTVGASARNTRLVDFLGCSQALSAA